MLSKERMYRIMQMVETTTFVTVKELTNTFQVSRSSIMRDLDQLEKEGKIIREHGGARAKHSQEDILTRFNEVGVAQKKLVHEKEKKAIAKKAVQGIKEHECVYIDSGTTPLYLLPYLIDKKITIVTPSTYLLQELSDGFQGEVVLLGGQFQSKYAMSYGELTIQMVNQFHFDHAFLGTNGIDVKNNEVSIFDCSIGALKQAVMKRSAHTYLLADASKHKVKAMYTWSTIDAFDTVYVDVYEEEEECPQNYWICKEN